MADAITAMWARARWKKRQEAEAAQRTCEMGPHCVWRVAGQALHGKFRKIQPFSSWLPLYTENFAKSQLNPPLTGCR